jgi:2-hydroxy-3-keto-5-methylthiopentenyl-1-phosphate phosphatase
MERLTGSPYFAPGTGIDKAAVVRTALEGGRTVAFAGDGPPDLEPALLVPAGLRFARRGRALAAALDAQGQRYHAFDRWAEVARALPREGRS